MSETFLLGAILSIAGGFLDAYTYFCRGHVFANAQTGNIVLLGMHIAQGDFYTALTYAVPILAFALGVTVTEFVRGKWMEAHGVHWRQWIILAEIVMILIVGFIPQGQWDIAANVLVSFTCAMQVQAFRKLNGRTYATTMCTGNLRSGTHLLVDYLREKKKADLKGALQYFGIIGVFIIGAGHGAAASAALGSFAVLLCIAPYLVVFVLMFVRER